MMILHGTAGITVLPAGLLFAITPVFAGDYATDSGTKFSCGLANTVTGWGEIPKNIVNESRDKNTFAGVTYGAQ